MEYIHIFHQNLIHNIVSHLTATVNFKRDISKRETNTLVIIFSFIVLCRVKRIHISVGLVWLTFIPLIAKV